MTVEILAGVIIGVPKVIRQTYSEPTGIAQKPECRCALKTRLHLQACGHDSRHSSDPNSRAICQERGAGGSGPVTHTALPRNLHATEIVRGRCQLKHTDRTAQQDRERTVHMWECTMYNALHRTPHTRIVHTSTHFCLIFASSTLHFAFAECPPPRPARASHSYSTICPARRAVACGLCSHSS